jgi:hypothetical protein
MDHETKAFISQETEKLAQMVQAGFEAMNKRFDAVEQRLDRIDKGYGYRIANLERDVADLKS